MVIMIKIMMMIMKMMILITAIMRMVWEWVKSMMINYNDADENEGDDQ